MAGRSRDWNEGLRQNLEDPAFAREFLIAAFDEGVTLQYALGKAIRAIGIKEFAARIGMASPNLLRAIHPRHNPTQQTLNRMLAPFGLRLGLTSIASRSRKRRAAWPEDREGRARRSASSAGKVREPPGERIPEAFRGPRYRSPPQAGTQRRGVR